MANGGMTRVQCCCGGTHRMTPSAMAVVVDAFLAGSLHRQTIDGLVPVCVLTALAEMDVVKVTKRYRGSLMWEV